MRCTAFTLAPAHAGQPVVVGRVDLPSDLPAVPLFTDRSIRWYRVTADDLITAHPAEF
jgi:hypothetical protein